MWLEHRDELFLDGIDSMAMQREQKAKTAVGLWPVRRANEWNKATAFVFVFTVHGEKNRILKGMKGREVAAPI